MKKFLYIVVGSGLLMSACSSSSRMGYAHFDDMYEDRPFYVQEKRSSQQNNVPASNQRKTENNNQPQQAYQDDEEFYGSYEERINRFHRRNGNFDYYSPFRTGFATGFSQGFNTGFGIGFGWGNPWSAWNRPWYSSSFYFGWGSPWGWNSFCDPFWDPWCGWNSPFWNPWAWNRPIGGWYNPWGSPWGWGYPIIIINNNDFNRNRNLYYGPRVGNYSNSYYNRNLGGRSNAVGNTAPSPGITPRPSVPSNNSVIQMQKTDKAGNVTTPVQPSDPSSPGRNVAPRPQTPSSPQITPSPERPKMDKKPKTGIGTPPDNSSMEQIPRFRYTMPQYESPGYPSNYNRGSSWSKPSFDRPSRPTISSPSAPSRGTSPSMSSPSRNTPSISAPSRSPSNTGGMERRPK